MSDQQIHDDMIARGIREETKSVPVPICPCCNQECDEVMYANINNALVHHGEPLGCNECIEVRQSWEVQDV